MCTILTIDKAFYDLNKKEVISQVYMDNASNDQGLALLCIGPTTRDDLVIKTFCCSQIVSSIDSFFKDNDNGRIFLHQRAATTSFVGVSYCHAFDNREGTYYMHNGIISNDGRKAVDSFNLVKMGDTTIALYNRLKGLKESFANIFVINTEEDNYGIIRMHNGALNTDKLGNFSTRTIGEIKFPVSQGYHKDFKLYRKPIQRDYWSSYGYDVWDDNHASGGYSAWYARQYDKAMGRRTVSTLVPAKTLRR
jgi:hypothetical protein